MSASILRRTCDEYIVFPASTPDYKTIPQTLVLSQMSTGASSDILCRLPPIAGLLLSQALEMEANCNKMESN